MLFVVVLLMLINLEMESRRRKEVKRRSKVFDSQFNYGWVQTVQKNHHKQVLYTYIDLLTCIAWNILIMSKV